MTDDKLGKKNLNTTTCNYNLEIFFYFLVNCSSAKYFRDLWARKKQNL